MISPPAAIPGHEEGREAAAVPPPLRWRDRPKAPQGKKDHKLQTAIDVCVGSSFGDGFRPIVFCRFIETADYVASALREELSVDVAVAKRVTRNWP